MGETMIMPAQWATLLQGVKPFGETDVAAVLTDAGQLLGFTAAKIEQSGHSIARIGGIRDFSTGHATTLVHSNSELHVLWDIAADSDRLESLNAFCLVLDLALLAKDRRAYESSTPMMAPTGTKDRLTNTIDRDAFTDYLDIEFASGPSHATVMVIGLDGMSVVNDTMSHTVGDIVIAETADRLRETLRSCDIVSRFGGDVFGIYCPNMPTETAARLALRLQAAVSRPIVVQSNELRVTAGAGIASRAKGEKAHDTLSNGDTALQAAKAAGPSELVVYDGAIRARTEDRRQLAAELVEALDQNQLTTATEPIVHLPDGAIVGVEAHVVWEHPTRGTIDRTEFMDLAELIGRVADVERAVLEYALAQQGDSPMRTGINISGSTLRDSAAIGWMAERIRGAKAKLIVEVSETSVSTGGAAVVRHLGVLRDAGASVVLDDFGLSFASLRTLHAFAFDGVKLHTSLLSEGDSRRMAAIANGIYVSAAAVGFDVVHSGVETDDDLRLLMGLDRSISNNGVYAQGAAIRARANAAAAS